MKVIDYIVLYSPLTSDLRDEVLSYVRSGWQPQGGVAVIPGGGYVQALVLVESKE